LTGKNLDSQEELLEHTGNIGTMVARVFHAPLVAHENTCRQHWEGQNLVNRVNLLLLFNLMPLLDLIAICKTKKSTQAVTFF
jgi:hypothetical protein